MAEMSYWWTTNAAGAGDQVASYTQAHLSKVAEITAACSNFEGVAPSYLNSLACTANGANTVAVNTGGAMVDGKPYLNSASVDVNIPSAAGGGNTRIDRIVLRASWAGFDIAITRVAGVDAAVPAAPAITQTSGTTYDIQLCQVLVDTAGAVTVTDERTMASPIKGRQGGSATVWATTGTTNYRPTTPLIQFGTVEWVGNASTGNVTVTFPIAFAQTPLVFVQVADGAASSPNIIAKVDKDNTSSTQVDIDWKDFDAGAFTGIDFQWLAIGPA